MQYNTTPRVLQKDDKSPKALPDEDDKCTIHKLKVLPNSLGAKPHKFITGQRLNFPLDSRIL